MVMRSHAGDWWLVATSNAHAKLIIGQKTCTHALSFHLCLRDVNTAHRWNKKYISMSI